MKPLPRLRPLEILTLPRDDAVSYVLRDPEGYSGEELVLSEAALFVAAHADGVQTMDDLRERFTRRYGNPPPPDQVQDLFRRLEAAHMLETEEFAAHRDHLRDSFRQSPVRPAMHAAVSYPAEAAEAERQLDAFFAEAHDLEEPGPRPPGTLRGIVAPHIDLRVGGPCTALAYRLLEETPRVETVVVLGTAHACSHAAWIVAQKPFETPLGTMPVDDDVCARLAAAGGSAPEDLFYHRQEHSIEFQALFLARLRKAGRALRFVPVLCGSLRPPADAARDPAGDPAGDPGRNPEGDSTPDPARGRAQDPPAPVPVPDGNDPFLAELRAYLDEAGDRAVVVAAADLAHVGIRFGDPEPLDTLHLRLLEKKDRRTLATVTANDAGAFFASVMEAGDPRRICGLSPIFGLLRAVTGARGKLLSYRQATDPTGTVSYATLGLWSDSGNGG